MEGLKLPHLLALLLATTIYSVISVNGQISTPCTASMISTFTPCLNFVTGSSSNGTQTPTRSCCNSLKSLMGASMDCACLLVTASVPVQLPINRTLALSLPKACKMGGVPVQCKASAAPLPAPGPAALSGPAPAPGVDHSLLTPQASMAVAPAPETDTNGDLTPGSPPVVDSDAPSSPGGIRPVRTQAPPSASSRSSTSRHSVLLLVGLLMFNGHY